MATNSFLDTLNNTTQTTNGLLDVASLANNENVQKKVNEVSKVTKQVQQGQQVIHLAESLVHKSQDLGNALSKNNLSDELGDAMSLFGFGSDSPTGLQFTLKALNLPTETLSVIAFEFKEQYSQPYELIVDITSPNSALATEKLLDYPVTFDIWQDGKSLRQISGMVTHFEQGDTGFHETHYRLYVAPELWRTTLRYNSRIFQLKNIQQILSALLEEHGIVNYAFAFRDEHNTREFCVQWQESDFDFIQRLTAEEGIFYYFEHKDGNTTIVFCDTAGALGHKITLPYNLNKNAQLQEKCVTRFCQSERIRNSSVMLKDYTFKDPTWYSQFNKLAEDLDYQRKEYEHYDYPGRFKNSAQGKAYTQYRLESLRNDAHQGYGESNAPQLEVGNLLSLTNHPNPKFSQTWQIISVVHTGRQPQASEQESGESGTYFSNHFTVIPRNQTWRPMQRTKPKVDGPQMAIVVGPKNEEIFTDNFGRIRLQFFWDREGKSDDHSSCWIRVTQPWAGNGWGMLAIPRVGQEVLVDFLDGDPDQPIVTGRTYHAHNHTPGNLPVSRTQMTIASQTYKGRGANSLTFEDAPQRERFDLFAQNDMNIEVQNDQKISVKSNKELCVLNGDFSTEIKQGNLSEKIALTRKTEANMVYQKATANEQGEGIQLLDADDKIKLDVNGNGIVIDKQRILLTFGGSTVELKAEGVFIDGQQVQLNKGNQPASDNTEKPIVAIVEAAQAISVAGANRTTTNASHNSQNKTKKKVFKGFGADIDLYIKESAERYNIDEKILRGFIKMENGWQNQLSPTGAIGPGQFTKGTWNRLANTQAGQKIGMTEITKENFRKNNDPRFNKKINIYATGLLAKNNSMLLEKNNLPLTGENLYMLHNIGSGVIPALKGSNNVSEKTIEAMKHNGMKSNQTPVEFVKWQKNRFNEHYNIAN